MASGHLGCHSLGLPSLSSFFAATDYDFSPSVRFESQRLDYIAKVTAKTLRDWVFVPTATGAVRPGCTTCYS